MLIVDDYQPNQLLWSPSQFYLWSGASCGGVDIVWTLDRGVQIFFFLGGGGGGRKEGIPEAVWDFLKGQPHENKKIPGP
jgi:hypothetical protein